MRSALGLALVGLGVFLSGCATGSDAVAANGGGGIEIPNGLVVTVQDGAGLPVAGARVARLANSRWGEFTDAGIPVELGSAFTDARGVAYLKSVGSDAWVEVRSHGQGVRVRANDTGSVRAVVGGLQGLVGHWPDSLTRPARLWLAGTQRSSVPTLAGEFRFDSLPQGDYALVAEYSHGLYPAGSVTMGSQGLERFELALEDGGLRLDDFEDGDIRWKPVQLFGAGYWWHMANNPIGGLQAVFGISDLAKAVVSETGNRYLSIRVDTTFMRGIPWANFGLSLGAGFAYPDFRKLTAVRMRVRGKGIWTFALSVEGSGGVELWRTSVLALDSTWSTLVLPASAFVRVEGKDTGTQEAILRWMTSPVFQTTGNGQLDVDDLVFEGITIGDWHQVD